VYRPILTFKNKKYLSSQQVILFPENLGKGVFVTPWMKRIKGLRPGVYELSLKFDGSNPASYLLTKNYIVK
jgi:hypothetical protein